MSRDANHQFVEATADGIIAELTKAYEDIVGVTVNPASPVKLFISWCASAILQIYGKINFAANQNLPSRATGENLDALAQLFYMRSRPTATPAYTTVRFTISAAQSSVVIIPAGTRVTTAERTPVFETMEEAVIAAGDTTADVMCECQTAGTVGNGYEAGQITECVDLFPYYEGCANTDTSDGGSDVPNDEEFYNLLVNSENAWSCAGPKGAYEYYAKSVSSEIADVCVNSPDPGEIAIYALMNDGSIASSTVKNLILAACGDPNVRPLTDHVAVEDPDTVSYNITMTYYMSSESEKSAAEIQADVVAAVNKYVQWQAGKFGRNIDPAKLIQLAVAAGAMRVDVSEPAFAALSDGSDGNAPEIASIGTISLTNGGYENE